MKLHVIQAEYGDCFVLESKVDGKSINILIDGGPSQTFEKHLKPTLQKLLLHGKLDLLVLSHIDNDHIIGLLDLMEEIKNQRERGVKELVSVEKIWHNSFEDLLQFREEPKEILNYLSSIQSIVKRKEIFESLTMKGFQQGTDLAKLAKCLKIPINPGFNQLIVINEKIKYLNLNNIFIRLLGPTKKNVTKLQKEWKKWFEKKNVEALVGLVQILDKSIPNLASIMFLLETASSKILFTGDGLGQDIVDVLRRNEMLDKEGKFYVDVLKVPHHGSDRNSSLKFFDTVSAKYYVISANGRDDNPSLSTLRWIIGSGKARGNPKKIILTNMTPNIKQVLRQYDQNKYKYECIVMGKKRHFMSINLK